MSPFNKKKKHSREWFEKNKRHLELLVAAMERLSETVCRFRRDRTSLSSYRVTPTHVVCERSAFQPDAPGSFRTSPAAVRSIGPLTFWQIDFSFSI